MRRQLVKHRTHRLDQRRGQRRRGQTCKAAGEAPDPYGCADAVNLLYTLGALDAAATDRAGWIATLQGLQDPETGLFREGTHHPIHTTAHCIAALELLDAKPRHPLAALAPLRDPGAVAPFLEGLAWRTDPWSASHQGAGLYAALVLAGEVDAAWQARYFDWLDRESDPATGMWRAGAIDPSPTGAHSLFPYLAGTFHYLFNLESARHPLRHPAALVDTCLTVYHDAVYPLARFVSFAEVDWVYCLNRALKQSGHREAEGRAALRAFAARFVAFLHGVDRARDDGWNDLHRLFGAACALAELQSALPDELTSATPLRLVLDRRPFI